MLQLSKLSFKLQNIVPNEAQYLGLTFSFLNLFYAPMKAIYIAFIHRKPASLMDV